MLYQQYYQRVQELMTLVMQRQASKIERAAELFTECIMRDGVIYAFGCGHSHMVVEEMFYRTGGLAPISAILQEEFMLHKSALHSSVLEQTEGISSPLYELYDISPNDILLVISTSGVNPAPIDMALTASANNTPVIGISSSSYKNEIPRHSCGKKLFEVVDLFLDNMAPLGDACVRPNGKSNPTGPVSTILSDFLVNCIVTQTVENLCECGIEPPVFQSANVNGGFEANLLLIEKYRDRVKLLDPTGIGE